MSHSGRLSLLFIVFKVSLIIQAGRICHAQPAVVSSSGSSAAPPFSLQLLDQLLADSIKFWLQHGIDREAGGWYTNLGKNGTAVAPFDKNSKVQADNLYWLSLLAADNHPAAASAPGGASLSAIADKTYAFLQRMRRPDGLFFWQSNRQGTEATLPGPHIFAQWQAITALTQYGRSFGNKAAINAALETWRAVDKRFYNATQGVYDAGKGDYLPVKTLPGQQNATALSFNTFMQGVAVMGELYRSVKDPLLQKRLLEAVSQLCNDLPFPVSQPIPSRPPNSGVAAESAAGNRGSAAARLDSGAPLRFAMNYDPSTWQPSVVGDTSTAMGLNDSAVDYAHVLGHVWRALDVIEVLSASGALSAASRSTCRQRLANVAAWNAANAFDSQHGGIMYAGYAGQPPSKTTKVGWAQTESLMTLFYLWQLTGEASYLAMLERTLGFIHSSELRDPRDGELFYQVDRAGRLMPGDVKAGLPKAQPFKDAFHTIRPYARLRTAARGALGYLP